MRRDTDGHDVVWLTPDRRRSSQGMQTSGTPQAAWGHRRIQGELARPGPAIAASTVRETLRRELPDRTSIPGERHLALVLREYVAHYNGRRPHQSRWQRPPDMEAQPVRDVADLRSVRRKRVVAEVINEYHHAA